MPVTNVQSHPKVKASDIPLEKLATSKALSQQEKAAEMTRQFESMLLRQILTEAQKTSIPSKFASTGVSTSIYKDMSVTQMADTISSSRSLGLARELEKQLSREIAPGKTAPGPSQTTTGKKISANEHQRAAQPPVPQTKAPRL